LLFIFITWDQKQQNIKISVARYAVGSKSTGSELSLKIKRVICALYLRGLIVNQVASNGASENVSALKMLATYKAKDIFASLHPKLPGDILVEFYHPSGMDRFVFLGGKMPHWIKRVVNGLENSSKDSHKRKLIYKGKPLGLEMIKTAWEAVELGGYRPYVRQN